MSPAPSVQCTDCGFAWNSAAMAEGLRLLGSCPKCAGDLDFRDDDTLTARFETVVAARGTAPHLVLGIPRR
jgi:hypothetical protein